MEQSLILYLAGVPLLGMLAQWLAWRLRLPSILLLLAFGVALGSVQTPDELIHEITGSAEAGSALLLPLVSLSVAVILFEGGLTLQFNELKTAGRVVLRLVTVGAAVTWALTTMAALFILGMDFRLALLLGAILIVTGPTVVAPLLRHIRPSRKTGSVVKWEGIVIDPIGAVLAVLVFEQVFAHPDEMSVLSALVLIGKTGLIGTGLGLLSAWLLIQLVKNYLIPDFLHGVIFLTMATTVFAISNLLQSEAGLVTVTVLGVALANQKSITIHHVVEFKEHLRVFLISCLFIVLGSRLDPGDIMALGWQGAAFLAALILVVRPLAVWISTWRTEVTFRERLFLAFLAPRGIVAAAVASVFALEVLALESHPDLATLQAEAEALVPTVFLVIVGTVAIYGLIAAPLARWLELSDTNPQGILFASADVWVRRMALTLVEYGQSVMLVDTNYGHVAAARMEGLPAECASILSEHVREDLDLAGIGRLFAVTPNDEVNSLAVTEYATLFGRQNVYQLPLLDARSGPRASVSEHLKGRLLFDDAFDHGEMRDRVLRGAIYKATLITEEFTWEHFRERNGQSATVLFVITAAGKLEIAIAKEELMPAAGQTVIALIDAPQPTVEPRPEVPEAENGAPESAP